MGLRVRAHGRCGVESDRAAAHRSVHGITVPGLCWAVDAKVETSNSRQLHEGSIVRYWQTRSEAEADAASIAQGGEFYKDTGRRYFDAVVTEAEAYWE